MRYSRENRYTKRFGSFDDFYRQFAHIRRKKNSRFCAWLVTSCWKHCCCKWTLIRSVSSGTAAEKLFRNKNKWSMFSGWKKSGAELLGKRGIACFCAFKLIARFKGHFTRQLVLHFQWANCDKKSIFVFPRSNVTQLSCPPKNLLFSYVDHEKNNSFPYNRARFVEPVLLPKSKQ